MNIPQIPNEDIIYAIERDEPYFAVYLVGGYCVDANVQKILHLPSGLKIFQHQNYIFFVKQAYEQYIAAVKEKIEKESASYISGLVRDCHKKGKALVKLAKSLNNPEDLPHFTKAAREYCTYYGIFAFDKPLTELARKIAMNHSSNSTEEEDFFNTITSASKLTAFEKEQDDFLKLRQKYDLRSVTKHAKKYGWLAIRFYKGRPWTPQDIFARLEAISKEKAAQMLQQRIEQRKIMEQNVKLLISKIGSVEKKMIESIRDLVYLRTQRADYFGLASFYVQPILDQVCERLGIKYGDLLYCSPVEVFEAFGDKIDLIANCKNNGTLCHAIYYLADLTKVL